MQPYDDTLLARGQIPHFIIKVIFYKTSKRELDNKAISLGKTLNIIIKRNYTFMFRLT